MLVGYFEAKCRQMDLKSKKMRNNIERVNIFGVGVDDISKEEAVAKIIKMATEKTTGHYVVTVNTENLMLAKRDPKFLEIFQKADLSVADGWWTAKSKLVFGGKEQSKISGVDLLKLLCSACAKKAVTVGFLGGFASVAEIVSKRQVLANPGLIVRLADAGSVNQNYALKLKTKLIAVGGVDILFVAFGMGKQEAWIAQNRKQLPVGVFCGVGGAFDYMAGVKRRAPTWLQNIGFEWLWRLLWEPTRIWRQRVIPVYFCMLVGKILTQKLHNFGSK